MVKRFLSKVRKSRYSCWEWTAGKFTNGYGAFWMNGKNVRAHCAAYLLFVGRTRGKLVLHKCDNPVCVRPNHLWLGTSQDNMTDKVRKNRQTRVRGNHTLEPEDVKNIRLRLKKGETQKSIALRFGVSQGTISMIKTSATWRST